VLFLGRIHVGIAAVHFSWGGASTVFPSAVFSALANTVPGNFGYRGRFVSEIERDSYRPRGVCGQTVRQLQAEAVPYSLERVLRESKIPQDPLGWLSPCILLGDTNWRPVDGVDEASHLAGPPWVEAPGAGHRNTYPLRPAGGDKYLPRYDRVLVRSVHNFFKLPEHVLEARMRTLKGLTKQSIQAALCEAHPVKHCVSHMLGDEKCPPLLQKKQLSDHWGVTVRVEFRGGALGQE